MNKKADDQIDWLSPATLKPVFAGRSVLVCITGGIAAYKVCTMVSRLAQSDASVTVCMSESATKFVSAMTFEALSGNPVCTSSFEHVGAGDVQHISMADRCDIAVVAPCTMNTLADLVHGKADNVVTLVLGAVDRAKTPVVLAPAMNDAMWNQPSTKRNAAQALEDGFTMVGPGEGWQACRHSGTGRMSEPGDVLRAMAAVLGSGVNGA